MGTGRCMSLYLIRRYTGPGVVWNPRLTLLNVALMVVGVLLMVRMYYQLAFECWFSLLKSLYSVLGFVDGMTRFWYLGHPGTLIYCEM